LDYLLTKLLTLSIDIQIDKKLSCTKDKYTKYENESFSFDEQIEQLSSNSFQVIYGYKTKSQIIKAGDYEKICEEKSKIARTLPIIIYFNK